MQIKCFWRYLITNNKLHLTTLHEYSNLVHPHYYSYCLQHGQFWKIAAFELKYKYLNFHYFFTLYDDLNPRNAI